MKIARPTKIFLVSLLVLPILFISLLSFSREEDKSVTDYVYKNGELIEIKSKNKPRAQKSFRSKTELYIKSIGFRIVADPGQPEPYQTVLGKCKKEKNGKMCGLLGAFHDDLGDLDKAIGLLNQGCLFKHLRSCLEVGSHYFFRKKDFRKAKRAFEFPCSKQNAHGCFNLGHSNMKLGKVNDALPPFKKSCKLGFHDACIQVAYWFKEQGDSRKDPKLSKEALKRFASWCGPKDPISCGQAGDIAYSLKQFEVARRYYKIGCDLGQKLSCKYHKGK